MAWFTTDWFSSHHTVRCAHKSGDVINFNTVACRISSRIKWYKNYKNRLRLAKVIAKNKMWRFLWFSVYYLQYLYLLQINTCSCRRLGGSTRSRRWCRRSSSRYRRTCCSLWLLDGGCCSRSSLCDTHTDISISKPCFIAKNCFYLLTISCNATQVTATALLSFSLSVSQTRALWRNKKNLCPNFIPHERTFILFSLQVKRFLGGRSLLLEIFGQTNSLLSKTPIFNWCSLVAHQW